MDCNKNIRYSITTGLTDKILQFKQPFNEIIIVSIIQSNTKNPRNIKIKWNQILQKDIIWILLCYNFIKCSDQPTLGSCCKTLHNRKPGCQLAIVVEFRSRTVYCRQSCLILYMTQTWKKKKQVRNPCVYSRPGDRVWP